MGVVFLIVLGLVVVAASFWLLGIIGPFVAAAGAIAALVVLLNPGGVGARIRRSPGWWGIPGMRKASRAVVPFAGLLVLYTVPAPLFAFAMTHGTTGAPSPPVAALPNGVGGANVPTTAISPTAPAPTTPATETPAAPTTPTAPPPRAAPTTAAAPAPTATTAPFPTLGASPPSGHLCGAPENPWGYNFCGGGTISAPPPTFCDYFTCIASFWRSTKGYVEECVDGTYSHSGGRPSSCSSHGGDRRPLNP